MTIQSWFMYLMLVLVATATPGPAVLFIITNSTLYGWRRAVFAALGNIVGLLCLGIIAVTGLGAILETSETVFNVIKYAGAAYLVYLGIKLYLQKGLDVNAMQYQLMPVNASAFKIFFQALGVALSNPKAIVFLTALFPQFLNINIPLLPQFLRLIATLMIFSFSFLMLYALLAHTVKNWLIKPDRVKTVSRASGAIFIGFGVLLAASSNK
ncbi:MAG: LysE family translocator [Desulfobacterales bacterium]|nr:LysE family translocator [Desulfobacterales bacterium]MDJ0914628.1 LysE family translocator [Desulfobacterales bacterium]